MKQKFVWLAGCVFLLLLGLKVRSQQKDRIGGVSTIMDTASLLKDADNIRMLVADFPDSAFRLAQQLEQNSRQAGYKKGIILSLTALGGMRLEDGQYDLALNDWFQALRYCDTLKNGSSIAVLYNNIGSVYHYLANYRKAAGYFNLAIRYADRYPPKGMPVESIYLNYGNVFSRLLQYEKAELYYKKALLVQPQEQHRKLIAGALQELGSLYEHTQRHDLADRYMDSAITLSRKYKLHGPLHNALTNFAGIKIKRGLNQEALRLVLEAKFIGEKYSINPNYRNTVLANIGTVYFNLKNYREAERYLLMAAASSYMIPVERKAIAGQLSELYFAQRKFEQAYQYQYIFHQLSDSLQGKEVALKVSELEEHYRSAEKDKEIIRNKLEISQQKNKIDRKNFWIGGITAASFLFMILTVLFILYKNRKQKSQREIDRLKALVEGEEKERSRLSRDLHDGVNSQLTAIKIHVNALKKKPSEAYETEAFSDIEVMLVKASADVRRVARNLAPDELARNGLSESIKEFCTGIFGGTGIQMDIQIYEGVDAIGHDMALSVYRIVQELMHNIVRHAGATKVILLIIRDEDSLHLVAEDNGSGINEVLLTRRKNGMGLASVRQRVLAYKGSLSLTSDPGQRGTVVSITLPLS